MSQCTRHHSRTWNTLQPLATCSSETGSACVHSGHVGAVLDGASTTSAGLASAVVSPARARSSGSGGGAGTGARASGASPGGKLPTVFRNAASVLAACTNSVALPPPEPCMTKPIVSRCSIDDCRPCHPYGARAFTRPASIGVWPGAPSANCPPPPPEDAAGSTPDASHPSESLLALISRHTKPSSRPSGWHVAHARPADPPPA